MTATPDPDLVDRVVAILGWRPESWRLVKGGGYTPAARHIVSDGTRSAFVKSATNELTARMLRREFAAYYDVSGPFMPRFIGAEDHPDVPILITEDLSSATWPPPWTPALIDAALDAIGTMHATPSTLRMGRLLDDREPGWPTVAGDRGPFLQLGLVSPEWLRAALPALIEAEAACEQRGEALVHFDLRSDNLCLTPSGVKIVDWAEARRSSARADLGFFLPSLAYEGGPLPESILPNAPDIAALVSGFFAARAGLAIIPSAPFVRRVQREQLSTALPWAIRALGLPPP